MVRKMREYGAFILEGNTEGAVDIGIVESR